MSLLANIVAFSNGTGAGAPKIATTLEATKQAVAWYSDYSFWGNTASIVSLIISGFVFYGVRKIRQNFLFNARVPELTEKLNKQASRISSLLNDFDQSTEEIILEIGKGKITLKTLSSKLEKEQKKSASNIIKLIDEHVSNLSTVDKDSIYKIYVEIRLFIEEMGNEIKDRQWR